MPRAGRSLRLELEGGKKFRVLFQIKGSRISSILSLILGATITQLRPQPFSYLFILAPVNDHRIGSKDCFTRWIFDNETGYLVLKHSTGIGRSSSSSKSSRLNNFLAQSIAGDWRAACDAAFSMSTNAAPSVHHNQALPGSESSGSIFERNLRIHMICMTCVYIIHHDNIHVWMYVNIIYIYIFAWNP